MATVGDLKVNISTNTSAFNRGMQDVNRQLKLAQAEFRNASSSLKDFGKGTEGLRSKSDYLTKSVDLQKQKVEALKQQYEKSKKETGENSKQTENLAIKYNNAQSKLNRLEKDLKSTNETIKTQENRWTKLGNKLEIVGNKWEKLGKKVGSVGKGLTTHVTAPLTAVGGASAKMAVDFEDGMAKISTIADTTQVPVNDLRKGILKLSSDTGIASTEIAESVYNAISSGVETKDAIDFVTQSTKLSKAGFADQAETADLCTSVMNSYGLEMKDLDKICDVLIQTQNLGKITVGDMGKTMGKVIPTAQSLGVDLSQLATSEALMTSKGIKSAEATTYLNSMLNEMGKTGSKSDKALREMTGKSFKKLIASGKSVGDVLAMLDENAKKNNISLADMFGSVDAGKAALTLSTNSGKDFNNMLGQINNSAGSTEKAFNKVTNTTGEKFRKSLNKLKNAGIQLGDSLTPIISKFSDIIGKLAEKFNNLTPAQQEIIVGLGLFVASIGPVIGVIGKTIEIGGKMTKIFGKISSSVGGAGGVIKFLKSPIGIAILAIGAIIGIGVLLWKNWDKIKEKAHALGENIKKKWEDIKRTTTEKWEAIKQAPGKKLAEARGIINGKIDAIKQAVHDKVEQIKEKFKNMFNVKIKMPHIPVPHFKKEGKFSLNPPSLPHFSFGGWYAQGGVFDRASVIGVGENGREAVMPLERNTEWIDELASKLNSKGGNGNGIVIQKMYVRKNSDIKAIAEELAFINKQNNLSRGGAY